MNIIEALQALKEGKAIRRQSSMSKNNYFDISSLKTFELVTNNNKSKQEILTEDMLISKIIISGKDFNDDEWEIVE